MIIKTNPVGQLANRIYDFSTFIAFSIENDEKLIYPFFKEFKKYFLINENKLLKKKIYLCDGIFGRIYFIILIFLLNFLRKLGIKNICFYKSSGVFDISNLDSKSKVKLFEGNWFTDYKDFIKHEEIIKSTFKLREPYSLNVKKILESGRLNCDLIVGVHIRKGDYKDFLGGKFYFENEVYIEKMNQFQSLFPDKKIKFLICSNEEISYEIFKDFDVIKSSTFFIEDLYCLAGCDYLIGPPSTFTMWASFYGNTPLFKIHSKGDIFEKKDFVVTKEY